MQFDTENKIIQLCTKGMEMEAKQPDEAKVLFLKERNEAKNGFEKFTAEHFVARHQASTKR